jgi:nitrate reductase NapE component
MKNEKTSLGEEWGAALVLMIVCFPISPIGSIGIFGFALLGTLVELLDRV